MNTDKPKDLNTMKHSIKQTVYLSGPMSGIANMNKAAFKHAEKVLTDLGYEVVNPAEFPAPTPNPGETEEMVWASYLVGDLLAIQEHRPMIALLPGHENSRGSCLEAIFARSIGLDVVLFGDLVMKDRKPYHFPWPTSTSKDDDWGDSTDEESEVAE
jgi:hypothetical protein